MSGLRLILGLSLLIIAKAEEIPSCKLSQDISKIPWSSGMISEFVKLYLKETKMHSHLHFFVDSKVKPTAASRVIREFSKKIPTSIQRPGDSIPRAFGISNASYVELKIFQAIYQKVEDVNVNLLKRFYETNWNTRSRIGIWIVEEGRRKNYSKILKEFWHENSLNVVMITKGKSQEKMRILSYNPFLKNSKNQTGTFYTLSKMDALYPDKFANMHGTPVRVSLYKRRPYSITNDNHEFIGGVDVECMWMASKWLNFSIDLITAPVSSSNYVVRLEDGSEVGIVGDVLTNKSDIIMTAQHLAVANGRSVEILDPFFLSNYVIIVPKAKLIPAVLKSFRRFSTPLLIALGFSILILVVSLAAMDNDDVMLKALRVMLYQHFTRIPATDFDRLFSISWIFGSCVMSAVYLSYLVKDMFTVYHYKDIDSLAELYDSGLTLMVGYGMLSTLKKSDVEDTRKLYERAVETLNFTDCMTRLIRWENVSCGMDITFEQEYHGDDTFSVDGSKTHVLRESLSGHWTTYVTRSGFPALEKFNDLVRRLMQFGLCAKWLIDRIPKTKVTDRDEALALRLTHLNWTFCIFLGGCLLAWLVFLLELLFAKILPIERAAASGRILRGIGARAELADRRSSREKAVAHDGEFDRWRLTVGVGERRVPNGVTRLE